MSDPVFKPDAPFGTVIGLPGVKYQQGGHSFGPQGQYISPEKEKELQPLSRKEKEEAKAAKVQALKEAFKEEIRNGQPVTTVTDKPVAPKPSPAEPAAPGEKVEAKSVNYAEIHWTKLRKMVEDAGGTYKGKDEAVKYLRSRG